MANVQTEKSFDILPVKANDRGGHDKIIADLHGNLPCLESVITSLHFNDRLFLTGDLIDRGKNSPGVIETIRHFQQKNPERLFVARGNHETLCLQAIICLEKLVFITARDNHNHAPFSKIIQEIISWDYESLFEKYGEIARALFIPILNHIINGGEWLLHLFFKEWQNTFIKPHLNGALHYKQDSQIQSIKEFISDLPYIIHVGHVETKGAFNVVHADMPMNDRELQQRIAVKQFSLSEEEKAYATWARESAHSSDLTYIIKDTGRDAASIITYVGHTIVAGGLAPVVRSSTNTVDLDVAAYVNDVSLVVDHTAKTCYYLGPGSEKIKQNHPLNKLLNELSAHLGLQK